MTVVSSSRLCLISLPWTHRRRRVRVEEVRTDYHSYTLRFFSFALLMREMIVLLVSCASSFLLASI